MVVTDILIEVVLEHEDLAIQIQRLSQGKNEALSKLTFVLVL